MPATLFIVSTPIGNLEDITLRALRVLREVDLIAAEDTRHSRKLLARYDIHTPLTSYFGAREKLKADRVLDALRAGKRVALISDAGTPTISDPGELLVRKAVERGIPVVSVPGPSAATAALSVSGLPTASFLFIGFLPPREGPRRKALAALAGERRTLVFYEAPHRLLRTLDDMRAVLGPDRNVAVAHELTKIHESVHRGPLAQVADHLAGGRVAGEYVLVVEGAPDAPAVSEDEAAEEVLARMEAGLSRKAAAAEVAKARGFSRKRLYDLSLARERGKAPAAGGA